MNTSQSLRQVLATRRDLFVIARTDSSDPADIERRVLAFAEAGADAVLVDGLKSLGHRSTELSAKVSAAVLLQPDRWREIVLPARSRELREAGVQVAIYSTPCLSLRRPAIENALVEMQRTDGSLANSPIGISECNKVLQENLARRATPQVIVRPSERKE